MAFSLFWRNKIKTGTYLLVNSLTDKYNFVETYCVIIALFGKKCNNREVYTLNKR
jgi:hypothetical protein